MQAMYDEIGVGYDTTRAADPQIATQLCALLNAEPTGRYLDVACGTGNYTSALAATGLRMSGVDVSARMLAQARAKDPQVAWHQANVERLPFADGAFDGAVCTLAIHHFPELTTAFREVRRVLRGGRFVLFTSTPEQMEKYWLMEYFPDPMRRAGAKMPSQEAVESALLDAGFRVGRVVPYSVSPEIQDLFLYSGKFDPALYFKPEIRAGISVFALHTSPEEEARGLARLGEDMQTGRFAEVARAYDSAAGDYLFIVAETSGP